MGWNHQPDFLSVYYHKTDLPHAMGVCHSRRPAKPKPALDVDHVFPRRPERLKRRKRWNRVWKRRRQAGYPRKGPHVFNGIFFCNIYHTPVHILLYYCYMCGIYLPTFTGKLRTFPYIEHLGWIDWVFGYIDVFDINATLQSQSITQIQAGHSSLILSRGLYYTVIWGM